MLPGYGLPADARVATSSTPLVGRDAELEDLSGGIAGVAAGRGHAFLIEGEPGIGKSALVRAALPGGPWRVLVGRADPVGTRRPFGAVLQALRSAGTGLPTVREALPHLEAAAASGTRATFALREVVLGAFDELAARGPHVVVLEDLHWADDESLGVLGAVGQGLAGVPLALVCTSRPLPASPALGALATALSRLQVLTRTKLGPLAYEKGLALAGSLLGAGLSPDLRAQVSRAGGNPLLVRAVVGALLREQRIDLDESGTAVLARGAGDVPVPEEILRYVGHLGSPTRHLLGLASVLGMAFDVGELARLAGTTAPVLLPALSEATDAGVLVTDPDGRLAFGHDLYREALYMSLAPSLRAELHHEAALSLEAAGHPGVVVAEHLLLGRPRAEDAAWLARLADATVLAAPATSKALRLAELAVLGPGDERRGSAQAGIVSADLAAGRCQEAEERARALLEDGGEQGPLGHQLSSLLVRAVLFQGRLEEARLEAELAARRPGTSRSARAELLSLAANAAAPRGHWEPVAELAGRAEAEARASGNGPALVGALVARGHAAGNAGYLREAEVALAEAVELADREPTVGSFPHALYALALVDSDRTGEARKLLGRAREAAETAGWVAGVHFSLSLGAGTAFLRGDLDDALADLEAERALDAELGMGWQPLDMALGCLAALSREGPGAAACWVPLFEAAAPHIGPIRGMANVARALAALRAAAGDVAGAIGILQPAWDAALAAGLAMELPTLGPELAALLVETGRAADALPIGKELRALAARNPRVGSISAAARHVHGLVAGAPEVLLRSAAGYAKAPRLLDAARAYEAAALGLARAGRREEALEAGREAVRAYVGCGADYEVRRARSALRSQGVVVRSGRARPKTGPASLTGTEKIVARYVSEGLSNPEIARRLVLSRRTVETHVSHILAKLGYANRTQLALAAAQGLLRL